MFPFSKCSQGRFCNVLTATEDLLRNRTKASNPWEEVGSHRLCLLSCPGTGTEAPRQAAGALIWLEAPGEARRCLFLQAQWDAGTLTRKRLVAEAGLL